MVIDDQNHNWKLTSTGYNSMLLVCYWITKHSLGVFLSTNRSRANLAPRNPLETRPPGNGSCMVLTFPSTSSTHHFPRIHCPETFANLVPFACCWRPLITAFYNMVKRATFFFRGLHCCHKRFHRCAEAGYRRRSGDYIRLGGPDLCSVCASSTDLE